MEKNSIEELKQRLEKLYRTQQARLDAGADDLDTREEIAEVEEEIKELQDDMNEQNNSDNYTNVGSIENSIEEDIECRQDFLEFDLDGDWAELKKILNKSKKINEYIMYKGEKWIKEKYCIPIQKVKDIIKELNIDIERNKRRKIQHNEDGRLQMEMIAYDPAIIKMRLLKLLESEETNDKNNKKG